MNHDCDSPKQSHGQTIRVEIVKGASKNVNDFKVTRSVPWRTVDDLETMRVAIAQVRAAAKKTGHRHVFVDGVMNVLAVCIDPTMNVTTLMLECHAPTSPGGHTLAGSKSVLNALIRATHPHPTTEAVVVYATPFEKEDAILIYSEAAANVQLFSELGLVRGGDGVIARGYPIVLCDGKSLGKSQPKLSDAKMSHLFPGVALDKSRVKSKRRKAAAAEGGRMLQTVIDRIMEFPCDPAARVRHAMITHVLRLSAGSKKFTPMLEMLAILDTATVIRTLAKPEFVKSMFERVGIEDEDMVHVLESFV